MALSSSAVAFWLRCSRPSTSRLPPCNRPKVFALMPSLRSEAAADKKGPRGWRKAWSRRAARAFPEPLGPMNRAGASLSAAARRLESKTRMAGDSAIQGSRGSGGGAPTKAWRRSMSARKTSMSKGLGRKSSAPNRMAETMSLGSPNALISTTRSPGCARLARRMSSNPLIPGSRRSVTSTSAPPPSIQFNASSGSAVALRFQGLPSSACMRSLRKLSLSSTRIKRMG